MTFFKLTTDMAKEIRGIRLTAAEWRLWSFLVTLEPFGDRYIEMPDILTIMIECGMSKATAYRAIAKFQEHSLFDFEAQIRFRNLMTEKAVSKMRLDSHSCETSLKNETDDAKMRQPSSETPTQQASDSPQTIQTLFRSTDNWAVAEKTFLKEEKEVYQGMGDVPQSPAGSDRSAPLVDMQKEATTAPVEVPLAEIANIPSKMAETPVGQAIRAVSDRNPPSLPINNKAQLVEPMDLDLDQSSEGESVDADEVMDVVEPTVSEVRAILRQLEVWGVERNQTLTSVIKHYYGNAEGAIASMKQRSAKGERFGSAAAVFVNACKKGEKPQGWETRGVVEEEVNAISSDQMQLLDEAKAAGKIHDHFFSSVHGAHCVVMPGGFVIKPWWDFLGLTLA